MGSEISLFSQESIIRASKKFVCVRLGTYESKKHQDMVRNLLRGSFQNTAFVVFAPDGKTKLSRSGRSPEHAFGKDVFAGMVKISNKYKPKNTLDPARVSDFHSFKQSLNAASADQRLLVLCSPTGDKKARISTAKTITTVFNDKQISGRFFYDFIGSKDKDWAKSLTGVTQQTGFLIIRSGKYGTTGKVIKTLPHDADAMTIKSALLKANAEFAKTEKRKVYSEHVADGRKDGIEYKNTMPPGEDRDGDGKIDKRPDRRGGKRRGPRREDPPRRSQDKPPF